MRCHLVGDWRCWRVWEALAEWLTGHTVCPEWHRVQ